MGRDREKGILRNVGVREKKKDEHRLGGLSRWYAMIGYDFIA